MQMSRLRAELRIDEGLKLRVYLDTLGNPTVGYGHQDSTLKVGQKYTMAQVDEFFRQDIAEAVETAILFLDPVALESLSDSRQRAIVNMAFNLGFNRLSQFKKMKQAIVEGDWHRVAAEALDSRWAGQVGDRAKRIARMLEEG
jgi:lysozyme